MRRVQSEDGRTRAFVNDVPVSIGLLRQLGRELVEIHGQHDDRALVDLSTHRNLLDAYGAFENRLQQVAQNYAAMRHAAKKLSAHRKDMDLIRERSGYLSHVLEELRALDPQPEEEEGLARQRQIMMNAEKIAKDLSSASHALSERGGSKGLAGILRKLELQPEGTRDLLDPVTTALEKVLLEVAEASSVIYEALGKCRFAPRDLDDTEERLFALREAARKYKVPVVSLPDLFQKVEKELAALDADEAQLSLLKKRVVETGKDYRKQALLLTKERRKAATSLDKAVMSELAPLKLEKAKFITQVVADEEKAAVHGYDQVVFHVQTNPGSKPGPMLQVASGGELSRFILALKVVLAAKGAAPVLIFDEIDKGVGGATATAIGERLSRLAKNLQIFSVTHAPQIAALADGHLQISKNSKKQKEAEETITSVRTLDQQERREEIARMLAGSRVTKEARAAADRLMGNEV